MKLERICSPHVVTIAATCTLEQAAQAMARRHVGALVVTEDATVGQRVVGLVTDRDLVLRGAANGVRPEDASVASVMTDDLVLVPADADVHQAIVAMQVRGVRQLVASEPGGGVAGIASMDDIASALGLDLAGVACAVQQELDLEAHGDREKEPMDSAPTLDLLNNGNCAGGPQQCGDE